MFFFFSVILRDIRATRSQHRVHKNTAGIVSGLLLLPSGAQGALAHPIRSIPQTRGLRTIIIVPGDELYRSVCSEAAGRANDQVGGVVSFLCYK